MWLQLCIISMLEDPDSKLHALLLEACCCSGAINTAQDDLPLCSRVSAAVNHPYLAFLTSMMSRLIFVQMLCTMPSANNRHTQSTVYTFSVHVHVAS